MALKAGYYGIRKALTMKLKNLPAITDIGEGLTLDDDGTLTGDAGSVVANPEGSATETLTKLQVGEDIYTVPGNDNTKCYQTDDATESAIVDADFIPFLDSSAASGVGAPKKSTWSNFCNKVAEKLNSIFFPRSEQAVLGAKNLLPYPNRLSKTGTENGITWVYNDDGTITINGTASAQANIHLFQNDLPDWLLDIPLLISGCPVGGSSSTYQFGAYLYDGTDSVNEYGNTDGIPVKFTSNGNKQVSITVRTGVTVNNLVFKPMLRLASDHDNTYAPYAMTNRKLTDLGLVYRGAIPSGASLDDYVEFGIWDINGTNPTNFPTGSSGYVPIIVLPRWGHGNIKQIIISRGNEIYMRNKNDGESWSSWYKFVGTEVS